MVEIERGSTAETLECFQSVLHSHFEALHNRRSFAGGSAPVFALEHGLDEGDRNLLRDAVVAAYRERLINVATRNWWLPLAVHAAEVGYVYDGIEFWPIYAKKTPGWVDSEYERDRVRDWFRSFADDYGGAIPQGAWASTFRKIAWPITHAVLPRYLQVQLAQLLYDYRTSWPSSLDDPEALGVRLHGWSRYYGERLEKFCQNTALLGHVAVALLLSAEDEPSPYIESSTLDRLVEGLNSERQSRRWLRDARNSASTVRTRNFQRPIGGLRSTTTDRRVPALTDPKLQLQLHDGVWHAYAVIPDLKPLQNSLRDVYEALRESRASITGSREIIRSGALLYAMAPLELSTWPSPAEPFLQLKNASQSVNLLIADQCRMTSGPWWVFRRKQQDEPAAEVKGKIVRPGGAYCIVGAPELDPPEVPWCYPTEIAVEGVSAYSLQVPGAITESEIRDLVSAGLSVQTDLSIQPVGVTTSSWDGQGAVELLAGEPALLMLRAEHSPKRCRVTINDDPHYLDWPAGEIELFLSLEALAVGTHEVVIALDDLKSDGRSVGGTLIVSVRDPQAPGEGNFAGEGIRLRTSPAQPSLPELWDGRAVLEVDGPEGMSAELAITLRNGGGRPLGSMKRSLELPVSRDDWCRMLPKLREETALARHYDEADIAELTINRAGVGFAGLTFERGYRGLRWVLAERRDGSYTARLIDRTDGDTVTVEFFAMDRPLAAESQPADHEFRSPPRGGLLWATSGDETAGHIIPPDPNQLLRIGATIPRIVPGPKSLAEARNLIAPHRRWSHAELPAHPFGMRDRERVLRAITTAMVVMLAPGQWAHFEHQISGAAPEDIDLDRAQKLVGESPAQRATAQAITSHLWQWNTPEALIMGFSEDISDLAKSSGMADIVKGARFLLQLTSSPGELADWDQDELNQYLRCVFTDPVLVRAARLAVLGTINEVAGGTG